MFILQAQNMVSMDITGLEVDFDNDPSNNTENGDVEIVKKLTPHNVK